MKICKIYIKNFEQFQDVELDFFNPETKQPVEKICFIGRNGTGKSKLLRIISWLNTSILRNLNDPQRPRLYLGDDGAARIIYQILHKEEQYLVFYFQGHTDIFRIYLLNEGQKFEFISLLLAASSLAEVHQVNEFGKLTESTRSNHFLSSLFFNDNSKDLLIYSPAESRSNSYLDIVDVPKTNVSDALNLFSALPYNALVSSQTVDAFWKLLVFNLKKRSEERENFERSESNLNKTKAKLIEEFDKANPEILHGLAQVWNKILEKAGLEFDADGASNPIQLTDNLKAYIRLKKSKEIIRYSDLSTGIRNFIFRIGHIYSLYFNREIDRAFLLIDEPENSLFPDFLFDLLETYQEIIIDKRGQSNTQMFFATHHPIIAAQFQPYERVILDWKDDGSVLIKKGYSPVGDDPNDVLSNDFKLKDLMGVEGRKMWEKYQELKKRLMRVKEPNEKEALITEITKIGSLYNFS